MQGGRVRARARLHRRGRLGAVDLRAALRADPRRQGRVGRERVRWRRGRLPGGGLLQDHALPVLRDGRGLGAVQGGLLHRAGPGEVVGGPVDVPGARATHPGERRGRGQRAPGGQGGLLGEGALHLELRRLHEDAVLHRGGGAVLHQGRHVRPVHDVLQLLCRQHQGLEVRGEGLSQLRDRAQELALAVLLLGHPRLRGQEEMLRERAHEPNLRARPRVRGHLRLRRLDGPLERARGGRRPGHHADPRQHQGGHFEGRDGSEHEALHEGLGPRHRGRAVQDARLDREDGPGRGVVAVEVGRPPRAPHEQRRARRQTLRRELQRLAGLGLLPDDVRLRRDLLEGRHDGVCRKHAGPLRRLLPVGGLGRGLLHGPLPGLPRGHARRRLLRHQRRRLRGRRLHGSEGGGLPPVQVGRQLGRVLGPGPGAGGAQHFGAPQAHLWGHARGAPEGGRRPAGAAAAAPAGCCGARRGGLRGGGPRAALRGLTSPWSVGHDGGGRSCRIRANVPIVGARPVLRAQSGVTRVHCLSGIRPSA
mmetsp:Transcript_23295/g.65208  ORF Transcript_23295/g.65208 Transcript_23295/m.65208 type:complete len:533 (+) Transcript_23295:1046-2644(+)